jgi:hypothetical protein
MQYCRPDVAGYKDPLLGRRAPPQVIIRAAAERLCSGLDDVVPL